MTTTEDENASTESNSSSTEDTDETTSTTIEITTSASAFNQTTTEPMLTYFMYGFNQMQNGSGDNLIESGRKAYGELILSA